MTQTLSPSPSMTIEAGMTELGPSKSILSHSAERAFSDAAFAQIVEDHADLAYNVAYRMLRNVEDAEDAVQEAFISAYRSFSKFKGQSKVSTWIYRIVVNSCLMKIRKEKSRSKYLSETGYNDAVVPDWGNDPEKAAVNS